MRPCAWLTALSLLAACNRGGSGPDDDDAPQDACLSDVPVRLAALPEDWVLEYDSNFATMLRAGDHIVFELGDDYHHVEVCAGPRVYGVDGRSGELFLLDRLDVPGSDPPIVVGKLQPAYAGIAPRLTVRRHGRHVLFIQAELSPAADYGVAGLDAATRQLFSHDGDVRSPLVRLRNILSFAALPDDGADALALVEPGELVRLDLESGGDATLVAGVRAAFVSPDRTRVVWQQIGDDVSEPVFLRAFTGGGDVQIGVNDFAALSWGRGGSDTGRWVWTADGRFVAQVGPDGRLSAVARGDTGAAVEVPEHTAFVRAFEGWFQLQLPDPEAHVAALWSPDDGDALVLWRSAEDEFPRPDWSTDTHVYFNVNTRDSPSGSLQRVERSTGAITEVLPRYEPDPGGWLDDGRIVMRLRREDGLADLALADPATGEIETLAEGTAWNTLVVPERGVYYLDFRGPEPGLWRAPIPGE